MIAAIYVGSFLTGGFTGYAFGPHWYTIILALINGAFASALILSLKSDS